MQRAFAVASREMGSDLKDALRSAADPVRFEAQQMAMATIPRIGIPWSRMRVGVTRTSVYVAPVQRGVKGRGNDRRRRPNLARLLMDRSMQPALDKNINRARTEVEDAIDDMARAWSRV